jgi:2-polyprenyl-6-methoxyphenol hydroxylase-like FAD-dependent oxidoreductase
MVAELKVVKCRRRGSVAGQCAWVDERTTQTRWSLRQLGATVLDWEYTEKTEQRRSVGTAESLGKDKRSLPIRQQRQNKLKRTRTVLVGDARYQEMWVQQHNSDQ